MASERERCASVAACHKIVMTSELSVTERMVAELQARQIAARIREGGAA